jgi:hypothetical protein
MLEVWHSCFMVVGVVGRAEKWDGSGWLGLAGSLGGWFGCWQGLENQGKVVARPLTTATTKRHLLYQGIYLIQ